MRKGFLIVCVLMTMLMTACDALTYALYNPDTCSQGETRKGKPKGRDWTDLKNHQ